MQLNVYEAKTNLSELLERAVSGEVVVIARAGKPLVRLVPIRNPKNRSGVTFGGALKGKIKVKSSFFEPLTDDDLLSRRAR